MGPVPLGFSEVKQSWLARSSTGGRIARELKKKKKKNKERGETHKVKIRDRENKN